MTLLLLFSQGPPAPTIGGDFPATGIERAEFVYLGLEEFDNDAPSKFPNVAKWRIAKATVTPGGKARERELVADGGAG